MAVTLTIPIHKLWLYRYVCRYVWWLYRKPIQTVLMPPKSPHPLGWTHKTPPVAPRPCPSCFPSRLSSPLACLAPLLSRLSRLSRLYAGPDPHTTACSGLEGQFWPFCGRLAEWAGCDQVTRVRTHTNSPPKTESQFSENCHHPNSRVSYLVRQPCVTRYPPKKMEPTPQQSTGYRI